MDSTEENERENEKKSEENKKDMEKLLQEFPLSQAAIESVKKSRDFLNSMKPNLAESLIASTYMVSTLAKLYSNRMLHAFEIAREVSDKILRMRREMENRMMGMAPIMLEFDRKIKQALPAFPSVAELDKIPNLNRFPDLYSGTLRATNAYIEALEKELEKEREENMELLKIIEEFKKGSKYKYIV